MSTWCVYIKMCIKMAEDIINNNIIKGFFFLLHALIQCLLNLHLLVGTVVGTGVERWKERATAFKNFESGWKENLICISNLGSVPASASQRRAWLSAPGDRFLHECWPGRIKWNAKCKHISYVFCLDFYHSNFGVRKTYHYIGVHQICPLDIHISLFSD